MDACRRALPDLRGEDVGSPCCIRDYSADPQLGGPAGLAGAAVRRRERHPDDVAEVVVSVDRKPWIASNARR